MPNIYYSSPSVPFASATQGFLGNLKDFTKLNLEQQKVDVFKEREQRLAQDAQTLDQVRNLQADELRLDIQRKAMDMQTRQAVTGETMSKPDGDVDWTVWSTEQIANRMSLGDDVDMPRPWLQNRSLRQYYEQRAQENEMVDLKNNTIKRIQSAANGAIEPEEAENLMAMAQAAAAGTISPSAFGQINQQLQERENTIRKEGAENEYWTEQIPVLRNMIDSLPTDVLGGGTRLDLSMFLQGLAIPGSQERKAASMNVESAKRSIYQLLQEDKEFEFAMGDPGTAAMVTEAFQPQPLNEFGYETGLPQQGQAPQVPWSEKFPQEYEQMRLEVTSAKHEKDFEAALKKVGLDPKDPQELQVIREMAEVFAQNPFNELRQLREERNQLLHKREDPYSFVDDLEGKLKEIDERIKQLESYSPPGDLLKEIGG